jgi:probable HAF family extracellular repeat protein
MKSGFILLGTALLSGMALAIPAAAQTAYSLADLGTLPGDSISAPSAINQNGDVVGGTDRHAFLYSNGVMHDLGALYGGAISSAAAVNDKGVAVGASQFTNGGAIFHAVVFKGRAIADIGFLPDWGNYGFATGINNHGTVVGYSSPSRGSTYARAFQWTNKVGMQDLGTLGGQYSLATSINNTGLITGRSQVPTGFGPSHAFLWSPADGMRDLGTIGGDSSSGEFINDKGHVVGASTTNGFDNRNHAFLYGDGKMRDLGSLGRGAPESDFSSAYGVNSKDIVVGSTYRRYQGGALYQTAFVWKKGKMTDLETKLDASGADYRLYTATAINDAGQITVDAIKKSTNEKHAVLLTPAS